MATTFSETHDLGFVILDDPSQGMDETVSRRLGEVISELSEKIQVVVATPDPNLLEALIRSPRQKNVIRLKPRDSNSGEPHVEVDYNRPGNLFAPPIQFSSLFIPSTRKSIKAHPPFPNLLF